MNATVGASRSSSQKARDKDKDKDTKVKARTNKRRGRKNNEIEITEEAEVPLTQGTQRMETQLQSHTQTQTHTPTKIRNHRNSNILHRFRFSPRKQQLQQYQSVTSSSSASPHRKKDKNSSTSPQKAGEMNGNAKVKVDSNANTNTNTNMNGSSNNGNGNGNGNGSGFKRFIQKASRQYKALDNDNEDNGMDMGMGMGMGLDNERVVLKDVNGRGRRQGSSSSTSSSSLKKRKSPLANSNANANANANANVAKAMDPFHAAFKSTSSSPPTSEKEARNSSSFVTESQAKEERGQGQSRRKGSSQMTMSPSSPSSSSSPDQLLASSPSHSPSPSSSAKRHRESTAPNSKALLNGNINTNGNGNGNDSGNDTLSPSYLNGNGDAYESDCMRKYNYHDYDDHHDHNNNQEMPPVGILELDLNRPLFKGDEDQYQSQGQGLGLGQGHPHENGRLSLTLSDSPTSMTPDAFNGLYYDDDDHDVDNRDRDRGHGHGLDHNNIHASHGLDVDVDVEDEDLTDDEGSEGDEGHYDDEEDDDDESCDSTVVNDLPPRVVRPPPTATKEQQARFYWELCYGTSASSDHAYGKRSNRNHATTTPNVNANAIARVNHTTTTPGKPLQGQGSWSASRKEPTKSCLSAKKTKWTEIALSASKRAGNRARIMNRPPPHPAADVVGTPRFTPMQDHHMNVDGGNANANANMNMNMNMNADNGDPSPMERRSISFASTPQAREDGNSNNINHNHNNPGSANSNGSGISHSSSGSDGKKQVKFGVLSAAEFESSRPTVELTPLTEAQVKARFCLEEGEESDEESAELHEETARNGDVLAMWEEDFDTYVDDWDVNDSLMAVGGSDEDDVDSDLDIDTKMCGVRGSREMSYIGSRRRSSFGGRRRESGGRDGRRSSMFFSRNGGPLIDPVNYDDDDDDDNEMKIRDIQSSETFDDTNHPAPSRMLDQRDVDNQPTFRSSIASKDSLQFSSPSTMGGSYRLSASGSENSQVTPTNDVTSSSSLLRSVHSTGGASNSLHHTLSSDPLDSSSSLLHSVHSAGGASDILSQAKHSLKPNQLDHALQRAEGNIVDLTRLPSTSKDNNDSPTAFYTKLLSNEGNKDNFSQLLRTCETDVLKAYRIETSLAVDEEIRSFGNGSFLDIVREIDEGTYNSNGSTANIGRRDVAEVIQMSAILLEQNILNSESDDDKIRRCLDNAHAVMGNEEIEDLTYHCAHIANTEWLRKETDTLETTLSWLPSLDQSNRKEENHILSRYNQVKTIRTKPIPISSNKKKNRQEMKDRIRTINRDLESAIHIEQEKLDRMNLTLLLLQSKCGVERSKPRDVVAFHLLKHLLPYECKEIEPMNFSYQHLDSPSSHTLVTWDPSQKSPENVMRDSISNYESFGSWLDSAIRTPQVKMPKENKETGQYRDETVGYLPKGSLARRVYCLLLESQYMRNFVTKQFKYEYESGILTVADAFQRLNLLALDIMELQKYYNCRLTPSDSDSIIFHVIISMGQQSSIGIRFSYDLLNDKTFLMAIPSEVFIEPITGEPVVPINTLVSIAQQSISSNDIQTNAFILKRTCNTIVDTLQGRNPMEI